MQVLSKLRWSFSAILPDDSVQMILQQVSSHVCDEVKGLRTKLSVKKLILLK